MSEKDNSKARYVIYGAGSIGCAVGGLMVNSGCRVLFVARPRVAEAIASGFQVKTAQSDIYVKGDAVTELDRDSIEPLDIVILTVKSQDTPAAVAALLELYGPDVGVVCLQNGVSNEPVASRSFKRVYGGLLLISTVQLEPSVVSLKANKIAVGLYPEGVDSTAVKLAADLDRSGFNGLVSPHVMSLKWAKLIANLNNASHAITGYWLEKSAADPEMRALMRAVREEGLAILDAAGIAVEPPDDEPDPIRIREDTARLRLPPASQSDQAPPWPAERKTYPSMLQDLLLKRKSTEADFLNGEIVKLGDKLGLPTPYNRALIEIIREMNEEGIEPGAYSPSDLRALLARKLPG
jgi:2-dehydropantoate 2-reductase